MSFRKIRKGRMAESFPRIERIPINSPTTLDRHGFELGVMPADRDYWRSAGMKIITRQGG
jgi:hypothetical protein